MHAPQLPCQLAEGRNGYENQNGGNTQKCLVKDRTKRNEAGAHRNSSDRHRCLPVKYNIRYPGQKAKWQGNQYAFKDERPRRFRDSHENDGIKNEGNETSEFRPVKGDDNDNISEGRNKLDGRMPLVHNAFSAGKLLQPIYLLYFTFDICRCQHIPSIRNSLNTADKIPTAGPVKTGGNHLIRSCYVLDAAFFFDFDITSPTTPASANVMAPPAIPATPVPVADSSSPADA